ncbi:MAG: hypothetical protein WA740_15765, partial [Candidatus Binataceae bacterium]
VGDNDLFGGGGHRGVIGAKVGSVVPEGSAGRDRAQAKNKPDPFYQVGSPRNAHFVATAYQIRRAAPRRLAGQ